MSIDLHFDEETRAGIEEVWTEWWAGELRRPIVQICDPPRAAFTPPPVHPAIHFRDAH